MRRLILLGLMVVLVLPAAAARRVTVVQLEQFLAEDVDSHRTDADIAHRLADLELTERLTDATLGRFAKSLTLGPRTALVLQLLADQSAFFEPPARELPATENPDAASQQRMMDLARGYVVRIWPHLPDFFVTRTTVRFDDGPQVLRQGDWPVRAGMHLVGSTTRNLTYRDGQEIVDADTAGSAPLDAASKDAATKTNAALNESSGQQERGMTSRGEFGPELTIVLTDTAKGSVTWSHWEETAAGLAAVYNYSVPKAASHFEVSYCCLREDAPSQRRELQYGNHGRSAPDKVAVAPAAAKLFHTTPGYHGTLAIDPTTGAILRVTLEAEFKGDEPISRAATMVQYGPVMIGDQRYIFPVRSLALSTEQPAFTGHVQDPPTLLINQTLFTHYHRLAATIRMLSDAEANAMPAAVPPATGANTPSAGSALAAPLPPATTPAAAPAPETTTAAAEPPAPAAAAPPAEPTVPEISVTAASGVPDEPANSAQPQASDFQLKLSSRLVDVGVVAWDKKGHPVTDLKAEDIEIYDNGHKQDLRFFTQFSSGAAPSAAANTPKDTFTNRAPDTTTVVNGPAEAGATVVLIDESHIAWPDMANAHQQILKFIATLAPTERVGIYTMTALGFNVLEEITTDHAALAAKLDKWMPSARSAALAQEEETRNRQSFNEVHSAADLNSVNGNYVDVPDAQQTVDPILRTMGSNPGRASLIILRQVARHLSAVTGHKNLVWVSSDNVFADWRSNQVAIDKSAKEVDSFAMHAQEAMNDAHVAVYPMDVSQLETSAISADIRTRNVELNQAGADIASLNGGASTATLAPGRNLAEMQQDMHPIQGPIRMVADATGGRVIRRAGDMAAALTGVVEDGHATYLVSFSPQGPADDQYHNITVKLTGQHKGLTLRYRTGYLYAKEPSSLKDRFQQAVWRPLDVSEIAVTANCLPDMPGTKVKLGIAATDLGLQQQAGFWKDKLDIFFIQRDDAGIRAQVEGQTLGLRLKPATYQNLLASGVPFEHSVELKKGMGSLRVLVVDENSGRMGSVTIPGPALEATP
jgi:VWFA-related protein